MSRLLTAGILQQQSNLKKQYALSFDGVNDYVDTVGGSLFNLNTFTVECRVYVSQFTNDVLTTFLRAQNAFSNIYSYQMTIYNTRQFAFWVKNNELNHIAYSIDEVPLDTWINIAGSFDGSNVKLYVNATENDSTACSGADVQSDEIFIGGREDRFNLNGMQSDIRLWNYARTQQQIQDNLNKKLTGNETGLVAYYDFSAGSGNTLFDKTANANHGTIHGATWVEL